MKNLSTKQKTNSLLIALLTLLVIFFLINMIVSPAKFIEQSLDGISAWAFNVLPSVLPFMFFTRLLSSIGQLEKITHPLGKFSRKLFGTPSISIYTFLMAILSGYPVGSKMVADLYSQKSITKQDAFRMSAFCSTSGPMFIVGAVGTMMFKSTTVGYVLFISHIIGAFLNGLIYRNLTIENNKIKIFNFHENKEIENNEKSKQISGFPEKKSDDHLPPPPNRQSEGVCLFLHGKSGPADHRYRRLPLQRHRNIQVDRNVAEIHQFPRPPEPLVHPPRLERDPPRIPARRQHDLDRRRHAGSRIPGIRIPSVGRIRSGNLFPRTFQALCSERKA